MNIQELEWVKRENLPITMMVMNNHALGMIRHLQRDYFEQVYADTSEGSGFSSCNFAEVAKAYGISSACMDANEVAEKAADFLHGTEAPKLLEIRLEPAPSLIPRPVWANPSTTSSRISRRTLRQTDGFIKIKFIRTGLFQ